MVHYRKPHGLLSRLLLVRGACAFLPVLVLVCLCLCAVAAEDASPAAVATTGASACCELASCGDPFACEPCLTGYKAVRVVSSHPEVNRLRDHWETVLRNHDPEAVFSADSRCFSAPVLTQWLNPSARMSASPADQKLRYINGFVNAWPSAKDMEIYGQEEYWATPEEFLRHGKGDCEDYALIKHLALRYFSWPTADLWVLLVQANADGRHHAVLAAKEKGRVFILDNLSRPAYLVIPESQYLRGFIPLAALDEHGVWKFARTGQKNNQKNANSSTAVTRARQAISKRVPGIPRAGPWPGLDFIS